MGFTFEETQPPNSSHTLMLIWQVTLTIENLLRHTYFFLVLILFLGVKKKKQRVIAWSLTEAEYRALANTASETLWLLALFAELGYSILAPQKLLYDNLGATHLSFNSVQHSRMKHIQNYLHFVRDIVQKGKL
jgi:hypothetical protein